MSSLRLFQDEACSAQFAEHTTASLGGDCAPIFPAGRALGSKETSLAMYMAGTCESSGGEPFGQAMVDQDNAVTFCCRSSHMFEG